MADWPTVDELKLQLGVTTDERDDLISLGLAASIQQVCVDLGYTDVTVALGDPPTALGTFEDEDPDTIEPAHSVAHAALILAVMAVKAPDAPFGVAAVFDTGGLRVAAQHPTYLRMLVGQRRSFGIA